MNRQDELMSLFNKLKSEETKKLIRPLINQLVNLEIQIDDLLQRPFIKFHPNDPTKQKILPAQKTYVALQTQYNSIIRLLVSVLKGNGNTSTSPLRAYLESMKK